MRSDRRTIRRAHGMNNNRNHWIYRWRPNWTWSVNVPSPNYVHVYVCVCVICRELSLPVSVWHVLNLQDSNSNGTPSLCVCVFIWILNVCSFAASTTLWLWIFDEITGLDGARVCTSRCHLTTQLLHLRRLHTNIQKPKSEKSSNEKTARSHSMEWLRGLVHAKSLSGFSLTIKSTQHIVSSPCRMNIFGFRWNAFEAIN